MKIIFKYDKEKDIWCLLNKGKSSNNSPRPTKVYEKLVANYGENPSSEDISVFIDKYISENNIDIQELITNYQKDWETVSEEYQRRAEEIFKVSLPEDITAYITINNRSPYDIENNFFYISISPFVRKTIMHELWHFYTWYGLGAAEQDRIGKQKYNELKESLSVLLNVECKDLLTEGEIDNGYPQHQELREKILEFWTKDRNLANLWKYLAK